VPLPGTAAIAADVLPVAGSADARLDYEHFSIVMSKSRRLALFTGVNIDGSASVSVSRGGDPWAFDGRIPEGAQAGDELYANNDFDRGHLVRREDPNWGPTAGVANRDTFHFTNCAPQLSAFNQRTWLSLEDYILTNTRRVGERANVFTGPVFRQNDPVYRDVAIPLAYGKVVAFIHDDGRPSASAYLIDHDVDLTEQTLLFGTFKTYQQSVLSIEGLTDLDFGELHQFDGFSNEERDRGEVVRRLITGPEDILV
jgi:endonuclease G